MGKAFEVGQAFTQYWNTQEGHHLMAERCVAEIVQATGYEQITLIRAWMEYAFVAGAKAMADDTVDTLLDYGTAVAGLGTDITELSQVYDAAANSLTDYYAEVLNG